MQETRSSNLYWAAFALLLLLVSLPYLYAFQASGPDHVFAGFLLNPIDGNSYLAKMRQGYEGSWQFTLAYTPETGEGSYLFVFYLFLGHLASIFNWSLLFTFHLFRLLGTALLTLSLYYFCTTIFSEYRTRLLAFTLAIFGSGLGWLTFLISTYTSDFIYTSDFLVPEAYPFLSAYANPHFAFGLAIQIWLLTPRDATQINWQHGLQLAIAALLLAVIAPFAIPVVIVIYLGMLAWKLVGKENFNQDIKRIIWIGLGSGPVLLYDLWVINTHPVLSGWNAQNLTPSPPIWDLFISMSPALILAILAVRHYWNSQQSQYRLLVVWLLVCLALLYIPFNLQRRFLTGYFIPVAMLASLGLERLSSGNKPRYRRSVYVLFTFSLPTNLIILLTALFAIQTHDSKVYLYAEEYQAFTWLDENIPGSAIILSAPTTGLYIPAYSRAAVIYGHPFETVNAEQQEENVTNFFSEWDQPKINTFLLDEQVDYIFIGPREMELGNVSIQDTWQLVYQNGEVSIYSIDN